MKEIKCEENWIDLSGLPVMNMLSKHIINWSNAIGYSVPFMYNRQYNIAKILSASTNTNSTKYLVIYIEGVTRDCGEKITLHNFKKCNLSSIYYSIANYAPQIIQYLIDKNDAYEYSYGSHKMVLTKCPVCGNVEYKIIYDLCATGFYCSVCSDYISIPNKIMYNILDQLKIDFIREVGQAHFKWMKRYFYDFYFCTNSGDNILIEMDGGFHIRCEDQKNRDRIKNNLAQKNNFKLIRIDCNYGNTSGAFDYIKRNILNSELSILLSLDKVDWNVCRQAAKNNLLIHICDLWENKLYSCGEIVEELQLHRTTVCTYLKRGAVLGLCPSYNTKASLRRKISTKPVSVIKNGRIYYVFRSIQELVDNSMLYFGIQFSYPSVQAACRDGKKYRGLNIQYITHKQYKMIKNNEVVNKEEYAV